MNTADLFVASVLIRTSPFVEMDYSMTFLIFISFFFLLHDFLPQEKNDLKKRTLRFRKALNRVSTSCCFKRRAEMTLHKGKNDSAILIGCLSHVGNSQDA